MDAILEAERRGILPADKQAALDEARKRGLAPATESAPPVQQMGGMEGLAKSVLQGMTFGFGDEGIAGIKAAGAKMLTDRETPYADLYGQEVARQREGLAGFRQERPVASTVAEIGGAIPTAMALPVARAGVPIVNTLKNILAGAGAGATYGIGTGEGDLGQRAPGAVLPAALGGAGAAVAPVIGAGIKSGVEKISRGMAAGRSGVPKETVDVLQDTLAADAGAGAGGAMLADIGPNARAVLDVAIQRSGPAGVAARNAIDDRVTVAAEQIRKTMDDTLGTPQGVKTIERQLRDKTRTPVSAAYDTAYSQPINYASPEGKAIEKMIKEQVPAAAIKAANKLMRMEGAKSKQIHATVGRGGKVTFERLPDVRQIDYIVRGLNQQADVQAGKGALGGTTQLGRSYGNLGRELRTMTRKMVPEYEAALSMAAEPIAARKALQIGRSALTAKMPRDELADALDGMTAMERQYAAQGVREALDDQMARVNMAFSDPNLDAREAAKALKALSSRANRDKISQIIGQDQADQMFAGLDAATDAFALKAAVAQNSKTYAREALGNRITDRLSQTPGGALRRGEPYTAAKGVFAHQMGASPAQRAAREDEAYSALVDVLTGPPSPRVIEGLRGSASPVMAGERAGDLARAMVTRGTLPFVPTLPQQQR